MDEKKVKEAIKMLRREKKECKDLLKYYEKGHWNYGLLEKKIEACNTAIEALEKAVAEDWIPVEEKLPEHDYETVLCIDAVDYYFVAVYTKEDGFRTEDFGADYENIIAWQPIQELYKPKKDNSATEHAL